ncbi:hypothetical protein HNQ44_000788 [Planomicrobium koreense]|uniref:Uncharacterized protein n=1 Tax=Planococcus koreensis TaxID=112331 RepID=A0A7W8FRC2_9BACL|nr:hypothetical protein [Planococcus koreensis]
MSEQRHSLCFIGDSKFIFEGEVEQKRLKLLIELFKNSLTLIFITNTLKTVSEQK